MTVVYSTDENYVKLTAVSMASLLKHNANVRVVVLTNAVKPDSVAFLQALCHRMGGAFEVIDVASRLQKLKDAQANGYTSYSIYARFYIPELLKEDRCLYIDSDTLVVGAIEALYNMPLNGKVCAIGYECQRVEYKRLIGLAPDKPYFNSGVLLIDRDAWQKRHCTERLLAAISNAPRFSIFPDQDLIARVLSEDVAILPPQYNFLTHFQMFKTQKDVLKVMGASPNIWYSSEAYAAARKAPVIHHFLGNTLGRPWFRESKNPLRPLYRQYAALTGVPEVAEQSRPMEFYYRVQYLCWRFLPNWLFVQACRAMYRFFFWKCYGV